MSDLLLELRGVSCTLGTHPILRGVDGGIKTGELVGLIGPNGSGKTTLFNCISGFVRTTSGSINFDSTDITEWAPDKRALAGVGRVFQNFGIFRELTVAENLRIALESKRPGLGLGRSNVSTEEIVGWLAQVGLDSRASLKASSLSGGQMRLLEIVRALAFGAKLFLLDEPTAGVSPKLKGDVARVIRELKARGKTVLIIEHDLSFIEQFCDRILVLDQGRVMLDGPPSTIRQDPRLQEIYFGTGAA